MQAFVPTNVAAFNGVPVEPCMLARAERISDVAPLLRESPAHGAIPRGGGRGFGDGALNRDGGIVGVRRLDRLLAFDDTNGIVDCEAGCTIGKLIETFLPRGWFPLVTPGTKHVTVGGAIASDVHGKNHHRDGSFTNAVVGFKLMLPSGEVLDVSRDSHPDVFWATLGGMGLTGVILSAHVRLRRVESGFMSVEYRRTPDIDATLQLFADTDALSHYSVAWIDVLATGKSLGRCVLMLGSHLPAADVPAYARHRPLDVPPRKERSLPFPAPRLALNQWTVKLFNARLYRRFTDGVHVTDYDDYFYPLDRIANYPWLYGRRGFVQYQAVLPPDRSRDGLEKMLEAISSKGAGSFLAVLKSMGAQEGGMLSFPMPGHTLALDLPHTPSLRPLIHDLDRIVLDHGGRVYLAKDAFLERSSLDAMYPRLGEFLEVKRRLDPEGRIASSLSRRLHLAGRA
jgi:decaprenylphospho-beta-D-ribofuranose 2-oxidase